jgi:hypothetical protein
MKTFYIRAHFPANITLLAIIKTKWGGTPQYVLLLRRDSDKSLAFPICSTTTRIFLGWVKEVRTTES